MKRRQRGSHMVVFGFMLSVIVGFIGLAIDLSFAYARHGELQALADASALAAARALDGTVAGVTLAGNRAESVAALNVYNFGQHISWSADALRFAASADALDADWLPTSAVTNANAPTLRFARVDTGVLLPDPGRVELIFFGALGAHGPIVAGARAVAGRVTSQLAPLAICAMNPSRYTARTSAAGQELVEHGFRRGVTYNLLKLSSYDTTAHSFAVNPIDFPASGAVNLAAHTSAATLKPYACSGAMAAPVLTELYVSEPFPASLAPELNTRFDVFAGVDCASTTTAPDVNVMEYTGSPSYWMSPAATAAAAQSSSAGGVLATVADGAAPAPNAGAYGTLWANARPVHYDPSAAGYAGAAFSNANLAALYPVTSGLNLSSTYSLPRPYPNNRLPYAKAPSHTGAAYRRILNVALLACPVPASGRASVLAIGKFMMSTKATSAPAAINAEFGGLLDQAPGLDFAVLR